MNTTRITRLAAVCGMLLGLVALGGCQRETRDYMVVANKPNNLQVVDLAERKVVRTCELPGRYGPGTVVMAPDKRIAYVLSNQAENLYGVDIDTCAIVFKAVQSEGNVRVKTLAAIAVSPDGKEIYAHQNPVRLLVDRYEVMDTRIVVYDAAAGLEAKPVRSYPAPRHVTLLTTGADGTLYIGGQDIFAMNPQTGETRVKLQSLHDNPDPLQGQRDVLSVWPIGSVSGEMVRMYSATRFADESKNPDTARYMWGYERVDLKTGEAEARDFGPLEVVLFSGMSRPGDRNQFYAVLTQLKKYDVAKQQEVKSVDLDHSYYCINFSTDGKLVYLAGTFNEIAIHDAETLEQVGKITLPGGDMSLATSQVFARAP